MKKTMFINDKTKFGDAEKVLHHVLYKEMVDFNKRNTNYFTILIIAVLLAVAGLVVIIMKKTTGGSVLLGIGLAGLITSLILISLNKLRLNIKRFGVVWLPVSKMPFQDGSILIDRAGIFEPVSFAFNSLANDDIAKISEAFSQLQEHVRKMPLVLSPAKAVDIPNNDPAFRKKGLKVYSEELDFINLNRKLCEGFENKKNFRLDINALKFEPGFLNKVKSFESVPDSVIEKTTASEINKNLDIINGVVKLFNNSREAEVDIDDLCVQILAFLNDILPKHDYTVHNSLNTILVPLTFRHTNLIERASYNNYCPSCNADLIEKLMHGSYAHDGTKDNRVNIPGNTLMEMVDPELDLWKCPLCEMVTDRPFPRHKMEDELFTPVYDKLYEEHFVERLKIYNQINDQKRSYAEKAESSFHEVFRETRTKVDGIKSKIRSVGAEIDSDANAIAYLNMIITKYKMIELQKSRQISADSESYRATVAAESAKSRAAIDSAVSQAQSDISDATARYSALEREDQAVRDSVQRDIANNTYWAAESGADTVRALTGKKLHHKY